MWSMLFSKKKGSSGFSSSSTAEEVTQGIDGSALTAIVTGATSGLGGETARVLALRGVDVIIADINMAAATQVKETIINQIPTAKVDIMELDLSSMESVKKFAADFISSGRQLNLLINNAGILGTPYLLSKDKIELQFAVNYLGHFLLTNLLLDTMKRTANESSIEGRIVNVASMAHFSSYSESQGIRFDQLNQESGYRPYKSYSQSKLAIILHTNELARRLKEDGVNNITANSLHPGVIMTKMLSDMINRIFTNRTLNGLVRKLGKYLLKTVEQGAATACYIALNPQVKGVTGEYFVNSNVSEASANARDIQLGKKLWDFSINLIHNADYANAMQQPISE